MRKQYTEQNYWDFWFKNPLFHLARFYFFQLLKIKAFRILFIANAYSFILLKSIFIQILLFHKIYTQVDSSILDNL
jgi:hypothetical protein